VELTTYTTSAYTGDTLPASRLRPRSKNYLRKFAMTRGGFWASARGPSPEKLRAVTRTHAKVGQTLAMRSGLDTTATTGSHALAGRPVFVVRRWRAAAAALAIVFVTLLGPKAAGAEELRRTDVAPLAIGLGSGALALTLSLLALPSPTVCNWCAPTSLDETLHSPWSTYRRRAAASYSHWLSFVVIPAGAVGASMLMPLADSGPQRHGFENVAMVTEALLANLALTVTLKRVVARRRPAFHYGRSRFGEFVVDPLEEFLSFPSGDTSIAFSVASSATTIAFLRGYSEAPYVLAGGATLATGVALLRVAADVHWSTDVLAGAVLGTLVGMGVPLLLHRRTAPEEGPPGSNASALRSIAPLSYAGTF
jgi:membrane-associated phospholipid phosphatase